MLSVENLKIEFYDHSLPETAVDDVTFTMGEGEILGIVGESGSGKSLTALSIAGLLNRGDITKSGDIVFNGLNLLHCKRSELRKLQGKDIAMIFQEPMTCLNPVKRIGWQVEEALRVHGEKDKIKLKEEAIKALTDAGLEDAERIYASFPHQLSGGQRQRVMIAAAMISKPKLLIADEPTTALDVTVQAQVIELLRRINREKKTSILFISHDLSLVRQLCQRVLVMKDGKIVEQGEAEDIFANPQEEYTKELIAAIPVVKKPYERRCEEMTNEYVCNVQNLFFTYGGKKNKPTLEDVSLQLKKGEILGLVGESGSGKSTLAKVMTGLLKEDSGTVECAKTAMIFQDSYSALNPAKTVEWLLHEVQRLQGVKDKETRQKEILKMLDAVELEEQYLNHYPSELSGGQRQRVMIAMALLSKPEVLIADEPVSALDVTVQKQIVSLLKRLSHKRNLAVLFISHDLRTVYELCDRVIVMKNGKIVEEGAKNALYFNPKEEYTKALLTSAGIDWE